MNEGIHIAFSCIVQFRAQYINNATILFAIKFDLCLKCRQKIILPTYTLKLWDKPHRSPLASWNRRLVNRSLFIPSHWLTT